MVTDRPPSIARLTAFGIRGSARSGDAGQRVEHRLLAARQPVGLWTGRLDVMASPSITLNDGNAIPQVGLGVFQTPPEETERAVTTALEAGYRHVDTAAAYRNESGVGRALAAIGSAARGRVHHDEAVERRSGIRLHAHGRSTPAWTGSVSTYLDLYLIHWPLPERNTFVDTFKAFANLRDQGRIRSIGVSNFEPEHLRILVDATGIVPAVNQVELHPLLQQQELREVHAHAGRRHRGVGPAGPGCAARQPDRDFGRRATWKNAGAGTD